ncbi:hypothetical protein EMGR_005995 [Emarellia grisea]
MPLRITSAPVSGIQKKKRPATFKPRASPFAGHARQKAAVQSSHPSKSDQLDELYTGDFDQGPLPDLGSSHYVSQIAAVEDVIQAIHYIRDRMFEDIPARAGMNSTRIAEVLNLRRSLPPLASVAHVHTLMDAPTKVEKEIVDLITAGRVRRLIVPGRGTDAAGLGDCLVLTEDWERLVRESSVLEASVKDKFLQVLVQIGNTSAIPASLLSQSERMELLRAGFLVSSSSLVKGSTGVASLPGLPCSAPASASRSGSADQSCDTPDNQYQSRFETTTLFLSLPNTGPYLRLLGAGRKHLLDLLNKSSSGEAPVYLLRDRWDGAVETDKSFSVAKRMRGEFAGILPGKTRKWKELYGMNFHWALEEALGAGLIEIFDTGSVGPALEAREVRSDEECFAYRRRAVLDDLGEHTIPNTFKVDPKPRSSPPTTAKVQLLKGTIRHRKGSVRGEEEFWACRKSVHQDTAVDGSASWEEFRRGLRENHSENEMAYTPNVTSVERLLEWPTEGEIEGGWRQVGMHVNIITHTFHPTTLIAPRTFISLVISADLPNFVRQGFMTVQIPLAAKPTDAIPDEIREKVASAAPRNAVFASYASVEQVVSLATPAVICNPGAARDGNGDTNQLEWTMATTSDAGGAIPRWIQRSWTMGGVPKAIVADVGYFISWTGQQRNNISYSA